MELRRHIHFGVSRAGIESDIVVDIHRAKTYYRMASTLEVGRLKYAYIAYHAPCVGHSRRIELKKKIYSF
jgi:hypothetical protein